MKKVALVSLVLVLGVGCKPKQSTAPRVVFDQKDLEYGARCGSWVAGPSGFGAFKPGQALTDARLAKYFACNEQLIPMAGGHEVDVRRPDVQRIAMKLYFTDHRRIQRVECHTTGCKGVEGIGPGSELKDLKAKIPGVSCRTDLDVNAQARCKAGDNASVEYVVPMNAGAQPTDENLSGSNVAFIIWTPQKEVDETTENVDWYNMTYGLACAEGKNVQVHDGEGKLDEDKGTVSVMDPAFGDLTGDGKPEAAVPVICGPAKMEIFVYQLAAGAPAQMAHLTDQRVNSSVRIEGGHVVVRTTGEGVDETTKFKWTGSGLEPAQP